MTTGDVTIFDRVGSDGTKRDLATSLTEGLSSLDRASKVRNRSDCRS